MIAKTTRPQADLHIEVLPIKKAILLFRAINHKLRQQILGLLHKEEKLTVTEIYVTLHLEQSVASQQLAILRKAGFVIAKRKGKFIYYSVNYDWLKEVHKLTSALLK